MSKPIFFTRRKNIARTDVAISLIEGTGQPARFSAALNLSSYKLPPEGNVTIEAYHNAYFERFDANNVADLPESTSFEMHGIEPGDRPLFRVKVIDRTGKLLAAIDEVRPESDDVSEASGSLLSIVSKSRSQMSDQFWCLHFVDNEEWSPELWINKDAPTIWTAFQTQDPFVVGLLMPEILRQVLTRAIDHPWTEEGTIGAWLQLGEELVGDKFEDEDEDDDEARQKRLQWVDEVVKQFAIKQRFLDRYLLQSTGDSKRDDDSDA